MKKLITILAVLCAAVFTANAEEKTKTYKFGDIESINATYNFRVYVTKGSSKEVKVTYESDIEKYMKISYSGIQSMLSLQMDDLPRRFRDGTFPNIIVEIEMDDIKELDISGAAGVYFKGDFNADELEIDLSGAAKVYDLVVKGREMSLECSGATDTRITGIFSEDVEINCSGASNVEFNGKGKRLECDFSGACRVEGEIDFGYCEIDCSGASRVELDGTVKDLHIDGSGACNFETKNLIAERVRIDLSGACKAKVNGTDTIHYDVARSCKMTYYGNAKLINVSEDNNVVRGSF